MEIKDSSFQEAAVELEHEREEAPQYYAHTSKQEGGSSTARFPHIEVGNWRVWVRTNITQERIHAGWITVFASETARFVVPKLPKDEDEWQTIVSQN